MSPSPDTDAWRHAEAKRRETFCIAAIALMETGMSQNQAARRLGLDAPSLSRYVRAFRAGGYPALLPGISTGRKSVREKLVEAVGAEALANVEADVIGHGVDMDGSDGLAWRTIARRAGTPEPVRDYLRKVEDRHASKHNIARSLRKATRITPSMRLKHRGARAFALGGIWTPRHCDILPGDIFSSDDTTAIWGCYIEVVPCEKYPTGYKMVQVQFLPVIDVASQAVVFYGMIARETGSYRASDVWRLIGNTHRAIGVPRLGWQKERGSWLAGLIEGVEVTVGEGDFSHATRVGGLRMLPAKCRPYHIDKMNGAGFSTLQTFTSYLPKSKSIEGFLHRSQSFEGTLWGALGRDQQRKPFEKAKKIFEACKRGTARAPLHFLSLAEISRKYLALLEDYHAEPIQGEVFRGRPQERYNAGLAEHGELLPPPIESGYLYRSEWSAVKVNRGLVRIRRQNHELGQMVSYYYESPELFARRDVDGRQVLVYFDRDAFESPADIVSLEGEWLGQAEYYAPPGMFLEGDITGHDERRASRDAVSAIYQSVLPRIPSRQVPAEIAARRAAERQTLVGADDGRGHSAWATTGGGVAHAFPSSGQQATAPETSGERQGLGIAGDGTSLPRPPRRALAPAIDGEALAAEVARQEAEMEAAGVFLT